MKKPSDRDIDATAKLVMRQHGESAAYFAAGRADELLEAGDSIGSAVWRRILQAVERLQNQEPNNTVH